MKRKNFLHLLVLAPFVGLFKKNPKARPLWKYAADYTDFFVIEAAGYRTGTRLVTTLWYRTNEFGTLVEARIWDNGEQDWKPCQI